jgi:hypothetical protein
VGVVQSAEPFPVRDSGKSDVAVTTLFLLNRRMRTRMSGGVRGAASRRSLLDSDEPSCELLFSKDLIRITFYGAHKDDSTH